MRTQVASAVALALVGLLQAQAPPLLPDHVESTTALTREFVHHASCSGTLAHQDGQPVVGGLVFLYAYQPFYWALPIARARTDADGVFRMDDVSGIGSTVLWAVSPDGEAFVATSRGVSLVSGRHTEFGRTVLDVRSGAPAAPGRFAGRLLTGDGNPIEGAFLRVIAGEDGFDPAAFAWTAADGSFAVATRCGPVSSATLFLGGSKIQIKHAADVLALRKDGRDWALDLRGERTLQHASFRSAELRARGVESATYGAWLGGRFSPLAGSRLSYVDHTSAVAGAPGRLPRTASISADREFAFDDDEPATLRVRDPSGTALAGATVDVCRTEDEARFSETLLQTFRTDAAGGLDLRGPAGASYVVYAYAEGHAPARGVWRIGEPATLTLTRRSGQLRGVLPEGTTTCYVRRAGLFDYEAVVYPTGAGFTVSVAPGAYELTCGSSGRYVGANAVRVAADSVTEVDLAVDRRPVVEVVVPHLEPDADWWMSCARSTPGGMVAKWMAHSTRGGAVRRREIVAEVTDLPGQPYALRACAPTSGRYTLTLGHKQLGWRLFREVAIEFGETYRIAVPPLDGELRATVAKYPELWTLGAHEGIAGPRLWLEPRAGTPFGALVALPEPAEFTLTRLPIGSYALHHHLYGTGFFPKSGQGAWGGIAVTVAATAAESVATLGRRSGQPTKVILRHADDSAARGRLVVRDRMFESWSAVVAENTTLVHALDPIPAPPSARLIDGAASLSLCAGQVLFALELDDGGTIFFARDVDPGKDLDVRLPNAR